MKKPARRGYALAMSLSVMMVMFMLGFAYSARTSQQLFMTTHTVSSLQASYLAEGGLQYGMDIENNVNLPYVNTLYFGTGSDVVSIYLISGNGNNNNGNNGNNGNHFGQINNQNNQNNNIYRIISTANTGRVHHTINAVVDSSKNIQSWTESTQ